MLVQVSHINACLQTLFTLFQDIEYDVHTHLHRSIPSEVQGPTAHRLFGRTSMSITAPVSHPCERVGTTMS
jgi:hypothetical protein